MSIKKLKLHLVIVVLLSATNVSAQHILSDRDSLPLTKPKPLKRTYKVNHPPLNEISIVNREPKAVNAIPKKFWGDFTEGAITLLSGLNTTSTEESMWVSENELSSTNPAFTWRVPVFFSGEFLKSRERVKDEDGSMSVETRKGVQVDWNKGAYGLILENGDTLGGFTLNTNPQTTTFNVYWLSRIIEESSDTRARLKKYSPDHMNYNFQLSGFFRGQAFSMVTSGNDFRSVILMEEKPIAIFQSDPDFIILGKKDKIFPHILFVKGVNEGDKTDLIRLSLLNSLIARCVSEEFYSK